MFVGGGDLGRGGELVVEDDAGGLDGLTNGTEGLEVVLLCDGGDDSCSADVLNGDGADVGVVLLALEPSAWLFLSTNSSCFIAFWLSRIVVWLDKTVFRETATSFMKVSNPSKLSQKPSTCFAIV